MEIGQFAQALRNVIQVGQMTQSLTELAFPPIGVSHLTQLSNKCSSQRMRKSVDGMTWIKAYTKMEAGILHWTSRCKEENIMALFFHPQLNSF